MTYRNPPSVVVVLVPDTEERLLMIRRNLKDGFGKLALPGGYQNMDETWQEAGIREVFEETGQVITEVELLSVVTVHNINLIFCMSEMIDVDLSKSTDEEVSEVLLIDAPVECAFPTHTDMVLKFFTEF